MEEEEGEERDEEEEEDGEEEELGEGTGKVSLRPCRRSRRRERSCFERQMGRGEGHTTAHTR